MKKLIAGKKALFLSLAVIVAVGSGFAAYQQFHPSEPAGRPTSPINYDPPTAQEKAESDARQAERDKQRAEKQSTPSTGQLEQVTPIITNASQNEQKITIYAYISDLLEDNGTCTATITRNNLKVTKQAKAFVNVSTTDCAQISAARSEFEEAGEWQVTVAYNSSTSSGVSQPKAFTIK